MSEIPFSNYYKARNTLNGEIKFFDSNMGLKKFLESRFNKDWRSKQ